MRAYLTCALGAAGVVAVAFAPPASADNLNSVVRSLNAVLNPDDARRLEDQSRREGRRDEERYWHNYGAGLEAPRPGYRGDAEPRDRQARIGPEDAYRLEQQARREGHWDEARYWAAYRSGLEGRR